jgi:Zn finger protein HypA/HybF involved in hydrogenase expression
MTLHITDIPDYKCVDCDKIYIPYYEKFPCPYCGTISDKYFNLIEQIDSSLRMHKMESGKFTPDARYT